MKPSLNIARTFYTLLFIQLSVTVQAQLASDYLCKDKKLKLEHTDKQGNLYSTQFRKMFVYKGPTGNDTCYVYRNTRLNGEYKGSHYEVIFKANGNVLVQAGYMFNGNVIDNDPHEHRITLVKAGEEKVEKITTSSDMSSYTFEITTTFLPTYVSPNGLEFKEVVRFDQYNPESDFHYVTYIARGQGIVEQGEGEMRRTQ